MNNVNIIGRKITKTNFIDQITKINFAPNLKMVISKYSSMIIKARSIIFPWTINKYNRGGGFDY